MYNNISIILPNMQTRYWLLAAASLYTLANLQAQTVVDATRIGQSNIVGTARYNAMAGAFGALGGDPTAMTDNPAGIGIYRGTSEITITPNLSFSRTTSDGSEKGKEKKADMSVSNLAYVLSIKTPHLDRLVNFNVGFGLNHSARINRKYSTILDKPSGGSFGRFLATTANNYLYDEDGLSNQDYFLNVEKKYWDEVGAPLLGLMAYNTYAIDDRKGKDRNGKEKSHGGVEGYTYKKGLENFQRMFVTEKHRNDEYNISAAFNWSDRFYAGLTLHITDFSSSIISKLQEDYDYNYAGEYTDYENGLETSGTGVGINLGLLWKPIDQWRIGVAVHTPTWYQMRDVYYGYLNSFNEDLVKDYLDNNDISHKEAEEAAKNHISDTGNYDYEYRYYSPWEYQLSTAYIFGSRAILALECDIRDFDKMKYLADRDERSDRQQAKDYFMDQNHSIKEFMKAQYTYKAGFEYRFNNQWSGRLGYSYTTSPYEKGFGVDGDTYLSEWADTAGNGVFYQTSTKPNHSILGDQQYFSAGLGWRGKSFYMDFTVFNQYTKEKVAMYPTTEGVYFSDTDFDDTVFADYIDLSTNRLNYELTIGMKF